MNFKYLFHFCLLFLSMMFAWACADQIELEGYEAVSKHGSSSLANDFQQNHPVSDAYFLNQTALSEQGVQAFLESSPYGRSWLADHRVSGKNVSSIIVQVSKNKGLNPILLLSRMQVEASLISATTKPSQHLIDRAMGCGCPDGYACEQRYLGLENQISCAAQKFRELYDKSANGSGWWRKGLGKNTLDHYWIVPQSHATAALYAYTPWVLKGTGGTWLAWRTLKLFNDHVQSRNLNSLNGGSGASSSTGGSWTESGANNHCGQFSDVPGHHPGFSYVEAAVSQAWISGCDQGLFCPEDSITRAQAAVVIARALGLGRSSTRQFGDLSGHWAEQAVGAVVQEGIMAGCTQDLFCPNQPLTRAQAAVVVAKAGNLDGNGRSRFRDVPQDHWAASAISILEQKNFIGGCSENEFCLDSPARRWIFIAWLAQVLSLEAVRCQ